jgi:hypothetical protein
MGGAEYKKRSHQHWGQLYAATDIKIDWHVPTEPEVDFVMEILHEIVAPALDELDKLVDVATPLSKEWRNDFNRHTNLVKSAFSGVSSLTEVVEPENKGQDVTDLGYAQLRCVARRQLTVFAQGRGHGFHQTSTTLRVWCAT